MWSAGYVMIWNTTASKTRIAGRRASPQAGTCRTTSQWRTKRTGVEDMANEKRGIWVRGLS